MRFARHTAANEGEAPRIAPGRNLRQLRPLFGYLDRYRWQVAWALVALTVAAATVLAVGTGLRFLVDEGFRAGNAPLLDRALVGLLLVIGLLALASYARFYLVSWIGERVVADIRRDVYGHVLGLGPAFFETTKTGEILSRPATR